MYSFFQSTSDIFFPKYTIPWIICNFTSILSVLLVAVYLLITIRIDPFGARHIINTTRCIVTCVLTWGVVTALSFLGEFAWRQTGVGPLDIITSWLITTTGATVILIITGISYVFIYRAVAKTTVEGGGEELIRRRREENKRVLRTFGIVYFTTAILWICLWLCFGTYVYLILHPNSAFGAYLDVYMVNMYYILVEINWMANSAIYWWRLKEFRCILSMCFRRLKHRRNVIGVEV